MRFTFDNFTKNTSPYVMFVGDVKVMIETNQPIVKHGYYTHTTSYRSYTRDVWFEVHKVKRFQGYPTVTGITSIYDYHLIPWDKLS